MKELKALRDEIDGLDKILLQTLKKRFKVVNQIARIKKKLNLKTHQKGRWESMMAERLKIASAFKLDHKFINAFFKLIHKESKRIQKDNQ